MSPTLRELQWGRLRQLVATDLRWASRWLAPLLVASVGYGFGLFVIPSSVMPSEVARAVMTAAALLVGFVTAGLVNVANAIRETRRNRIEQLRRYHRVLRRFQEAFWALDVDLMNRYPIDTQPTVALDDLLAEPDFFQSTEKPHLLMFRRCVEMIGRDYFINDGWVAGNRLLSLRELHEIHDAFERLSGTFSRQKHYGPLVRELGYEPNTRLEEVEVATWRAIRLKVVKLGAAGAKRWQVLAYWEDLVERGFELTRRMRRIAFELEAHRPTAIDDLSALLLWGIFLCVIVPLGAQVVPADYWLARGLMGVGAVSLAVGLAVAWVVVRAWVIGRPPREEGTLEV